MVLSKAMGVEPSLIGPTSHLPPKEAKKTNYRETKKELLNMVGLYSEVYIFYQDNKNGFTVWLLTRAWLYDVLFWIMYHSVWNISSQYD